MDKPLLFSLLVFLFALFFILNRGLREDFLRGAELARTLFPDWNPEEMVSDFQKGMVRAKKLSDLAFYEGWETVGTEITKAGDTLLLRRQLWEKEDEKAFPDLHSVWDTTAIIEALKKEKLWNSSWARRMRYVDQYHRLAVDEMLISGIPASITLAQALCESNAGRGTLALKANNHFGVKCRLRKGRKDHWNAENFYPGSIACGCLNHDDDNKWDHFRVYCGGEGVAASFKDHTLVLENPRYERLFAYQVSDQLYRIDQSWFGVKEVPYYAGAAAMLKAGGYATAPNYHWTITVIIDRLQLWRIDFAVISMLR